MRDSIVGAAVLEVLIVIGIPILILILLVNFGGL